MSIYKHENPPTFSAFKSGIKKRVLFVITQSEIGGAQRFLINLLTHLSKEKYDFMVAIGSSGNEDLFRILHSKRIPTHRLSSLVRNPNLKKDLGAFLEIRKLIKEYRPGTIFLSSSKAGFIGSLAVRYPTKIKNLKVVYRIGGWSFNDPGSNRQKWFWKFLEWLSAKWKDVIILNNQRDFDQAIHLKIRPREKLSLVHNGIETYKLNVMESKDAKIKLKIPDDKYVIGAIANFYPSKGLEYLIKAASCFKDNNNVFFLIIGDGQKRIEIEKLIKELGLEEKVILAGIISDAHELLSAFDVFVLPSIKEGFPWVLIEAMASRLPIIATNVGAVPEIIENGKNGFIIEPGNPQAIADKIKEIMSSNHLQKELGIQAHQTVLFKFELDKMVSRIEELL